MSDGQQYWYSVETSGQNQFGYIDWQGKPSAGIASLRFINGQWVDPSIDTSIHVAPFSEGGSRLVVEWALPTSASPDNLLSLAFKATIDLARPLPLDQFSAEDSYYQVTPAFGLPPETSAVQSITPMQQPPAGEGEPPAES
ncbi:MAG TPA: hypothetical protein VE961_14245 [Pyrinomonadaceae bacterium]|nr:hypothetical protein [Pyrinomonadaceae bacterium]